MRDKLFYFFFFDYTGTSPPFNAAVDELVDHVTGSGRRSAPIHHQFSSAAVGRTASRFRSWPIRSWCRYVVQPDLIDYPDRNGDVNYTTGATANSRLFHTSIKWLNNAICELSIWIVNDGWLISAADDITESNVKDVENTTPAAEPVELANAPNLTDPCLDEQQYIEEHMMVDDVMSSVSARTEALANTCSTFKLRGRGHHPSHGNA